MSTVKLNYSAMSNITFHGVIDSGVDWEDWRDMDHQQRYKVCADALFDLVDIDAEDDPGTDNRGGEE